MGTVFTMMIERLQNAIRETADFDGALIVSPENRFYFTGFPSSDGFLLVSADRAVFITDGRYIEAAQAKVKDCEVVLMGTAATQIFELFAEMHVSRVAVEASRMTLSQYQKYAAALEPMALLADSTLDNIICALRAVKQPFEVEKIKAAQKIAEDAFSYICTFIEPGKTEREIALALDYYMLSHGAQALSFETIAVSGAKTSMPHGVPGENTIQKGDFVTMDFGAVVDGYHSDMTRTVAVGQVSKRQREVYETVLRAQRAVLDKLRAGIPCAAADKVARDVISAAGYGEYFTHSTGHGVGVEIHEYPSLSPRSQTVLTVGNVVTDEPGVYLPGEFGVRIEDMALITENGCENLTAAPKELIIL